MIFTIATLESNTDGGVLVVHWRASKVSGEYTASSYGTVSYTPDATAEGYVAYDSLTEETVIGWIQESLDTESLEAALDADLQEQSNPTVIVGKPF